MRFAHNPGKDLKFRIKRAPVAEGPRSFPSPSAYLFSQAVSRHFLTRHSDASSSSKCGGLDCSVPVALVHLMAGNVLAAIEQIGRARAASPDPKVALLASPHSSLTVPL